MSNRRKVRGCQLAPHANLKPGLYIMEVEHDNGCPALRTQRMGDCTCQSVNQRLHRYADWRAGQ